MTTILELFDATVNTRPNAVAVRRKQYGIWEETTWHTLAQKVTIVSALLTAKGVRAGSHVAIFADNSVEWLVTQLAIMDCGAVVVALYPEMADADLRRVLSSLSLSCLVVGNNDYAERLRQAILPNSSSLISVDDLRIHLKRNYDNHTLARPSRHTHKAHEVVFVTVSMGTTGPCSLVSLSHQNLIAGAKALQQEFEINAQDDTFSVLPLAHPVEQSFSVMVPMLSGSCAHFGESRRTIAGDLRDVEPTVVLGMPRLWQRLDVECKLAVQNTRGLRRRLIESFMHKHTSDKASSSKLHYGIIGAPLRRKLGLAKTRIALSFGARLTPRLTADFNLLGVKLVETYGGTRMGGIVAAACEPDGLLRLLPGIQARAASNAEILFQGAQLAGSEHLQNDWLRTGDLGSVAGNHIEVWCGQHAINAEKEEIVRDLGAIESELEGDEFIRHALVMNTRQGLHAVLCLDKDMMAQWANTHRITFVDMNSLLNHTLVKDLLSELVSRVNARSHNDSRLISYSVFGAPPSPSKGHLTPLLTPRYTAVWECGEVVSA